MDDLTRIRNISIIAHIDAGKTTTTERMLFYTGKTHRVGEIDDGSTVMDYLEEERARGITIVSAAASFEWRDHLLHLIDTPGHIDFTAEVERSLRVIDGAVVIFSGREGVEAQSEKVWHQADHYHVPRIAFVNKLDRIGADFDRVCAEINAKFGDKALPLTVPVGQEDQLEGVLDLLTEQMLRFTGPEGETVAAEPVPEEQTARCRELRTQLVERLADHSDELAMRYLEGETIDVDELRQEIRRQTLANRVVPVFAGSAKRNLGVQPVMDAVVAYLPSPADIPEVPVLSAKDEEPLTLPVREDGPFAGLIFKVVASPSADIYYLRTYTGTLSAGDEVYVPRLKSRLRLKRLLRLYAKSTEAIDRVGPGDIIGLVGPRDLVTGDTLCSFHQPVLCERIEFPEPVISIAVEPRSSRDKDRLDEALAMLCREDPTLVSGKDENTGQRLLSGMGELHLEVKLKRVDEELNVPVRAGEPRVAYRETIAGDCRHRSVFHRFLGETELLAGVTVRLEPLASGEKAFEVVSKVPKGTVPKPLVAAALQTLDDGLRTGGNQGYPLIYVRATLEDIEVHTDKTTDGAVSGAVLQALDEIIRAAGTVLLEPIMHLEVLCPGDCVGEINLDLQRRRATIDTFGKLADLEKITCEVPLAEMFGFSKALPKLSGGRGSFSMEPQGYRAREEG